MLAISELSMEELFGAFPEPVILYSAKALLYLNPAAQTLFPQAQIGEAPPALLTEAGGGALLMAQVGNQDWRISVQANPAGFLAIFRREREEGRPKADRLTLQLRQETAALSAALQRLTPLRARSEEKYRQYLAHANQNLYRIIRLTGNLGFLEGEAPYRPASLDLAGLCRSLAAELEDLSRDCGWRFSYESDVVTLLTLGDEAVLRRLLGALLSNAARAALNGGRFGLKLSRLRDRAVLTVWDDGAGIDGADMAALFGEESGEAGLDPARGAGLGLRTVRRGARLHGGTVMLESRPGEGFRATVSLPFRAPESGLPIRAHQRDYESGQLSALLIELADMLPAAFFELEEDQ